MCVKEFLGYHCGHCSTPWLRACPVTAANPAYPVCQFPAERPIGVNENCHSCTRVLWNMDVLRKEEEHRQLHKRGACECEVMFDEEERQRRKHRSKGKGKGNEHGGVEVGQIENPSHSNGEFGAGYGETSVGLETVNGNPLREAGPSDLLPSSPQPSNPHQNWAPDAQMAAYQYVGYNGAGQMGLGQRLRQHEQAGGIPVGPADPKTTLRPHPYSSDVGRMAMGRMDMDQVAAGQGFPDGGFVPKEYLWEGQKQIGEQGAGMKWYPNQHADNIPPVPEFYCPPAPETASPYLNSPRPVAAYAAPAAAPAAFAPKPPVFNPTAVPFARVFEKKPIIWQRAQSEPAPDLVTSPAPTNAEPVSSAKPEQREPVVVSSDMAL